MAGMRETQLTADVELLSSTVETKNKQHTRPPISMNFEVRISVHSVAKTAPMHTLNCLIQFLQVMFPIVLSSGSFCLFRIKSALSKSV